MTRFVVVHAVIYAALGGVAAAIAWAREQIGCGYDYGAIAGFVLREPLERPRRWQCVELVETALRMAGRPRFRRPEHRITVAQSYMAR